MDNYFLTTKCNFRSCLFTSSHIYAFLFTDREQRKLKMSPGMPTKQCEAGAKMGAGP